MKTTYFPSCPHTDLILKKTMRRCALSAVLGMLAANVTNRKAIGAGNHPGGDGAELMQALSVGISNCGSSKIRFTCDVLCRVVVGVVTKFIAGYDQDTFSPCVPGSKDHS